MVGNRFKTLNQPGLVLVGMTWALLLLWFGHGFYWERQRGAELVYPMQQDLGSNLWLERESQVSQRFKTVENTLTGLSLLLEAATSNQIQGTLAVQLVTEDASRLAEVSLAQIRQSPLLQIDLQALPVRKGSLVELKLSLTGDARKLVAAKTMNNPALSKDVFWSALEVNHEVALENLMFRPTYLGHRDIKDADYFSWTSEFAELASKLTDDKPTWVVGVMTLSGLLTVLFASLFVYESWLLVTGKMTVQEQWRQLVYLGLLVLVVVVVG